MLRMQDRLRQLAALTRRRLWLPVLLALLTCEARAEDPPQTVISLAWNHSGECRLRASLPALQDKIQNPQSVLMLKIPNTYRDAVTVKVLSRSNEHLLFSLTTLKPRGTAHMYFEAPVAIEAEISHQEGNAGRLKGLLAIRTAARVGTAQNQLFLELGKTDAADHAQLSTTGFSENRRKAFIISHNLTPEELLPPPITYTTIDLLATDQPPADPSVSTAAVNQPASTDEQLTGIIADLSALSASLDETIKEPVLNEHELIQALTTQTLSVSSIMSILKNSGMPVIQYEAVSRLNLKDANFSYHVRTSSDDEEKCGNNMIIKVVHAQDTQQIKEIINSEYSQAMKHKVQHLPIRYHWRGHNIFISAQAASDSFSLSQLLKQKRALSHDFRLKIFQGILSNLQQLYDQGLAPLRLAPGNIVAGPGSVLSLEQPRHIEFRTPYTASLLAQLTPDRIRQNRGQLMELYLLLSAGITKSSGFDTSEAWSAEIQRRLQQPPLSAEHKVILAIATGQQTKDYPTNIAWKLNQLLEGSQSAAARNQEAASATTARKRKVSFTTPLPSATSDSSVPPPLHLSRKTSK